jgi:xylose isomerase-like TIM barrel protein
MDRRAFLHTSVIATLAGKVLSDTTLARAQAPAQVPAGTAPAPATTRRLIMDAYTRHLHWIRSADEIAEVAIELTCGGVNPTIQQYPGHINPANVATELPAFVKTMQKHGLRVKQVRGGNQTQVDPTVETMVGTMGQVGVTHYWIGTDNYDLTKPILPQLDGIKSRVERFVKLNQKHGTTLMYHTRAGSGSVGSVVWDLLYVMKDFDPKHVGFHWDTGHMSHHGSMWELLMRTAGRYVVAMGWKDRSWEQNLGLLGEGGPFPGPQQPAAPSADAGRGGRGGRGARGDAAQGARGRGAAAGGGDGDAPPAGRAGGGGGRGGQRELPLTLAGNTFARGGGWNSPYVPMGTGLVDIFRYAAVMRDIGFDGPMELEAEYPNGGSENGADKISLPRAQVLGHLKRDVLTIRAAFSQSETGLAI